MRLDKGGDGVWLRGMPVWVVDTLMRLPGWLESEDPRVRDRLVPRAHDDDEQEAEWQRHVSPELEHLFATRTEIIRKDLGNLQIDELEGIEDLSELGADEDGVVAVPNHATFALFLPAAHVSAWMTGMQAATHTIFILDELTEEDMQVSPYDIEDTEKQVSLARMHALQELITLIVEDE